MLESPRLSCDERLREESVSQMRTLAAVDLGASSGRVVAASVTDRGITLRETHRFINAPVRVSGVLRWDILALYRGVLDGLKQLEHEDGALAGIGIDSWAVDYGLLDADAQLLGNPVHYRDGRTTAVLERVLADVGAPALYAATGIQLQPFNTLFQLLAELGVQLPLARQALLIPDLISFWLSGVRGTELTNASTTGLIDPRTGTWDGALAARLGAPIGLFAPIRAPGTILGPLQADVATDVGLSGSPQIITVPSHDTAAAVAGIPAAVEDFAYVCTGTWALVGLELRSPVITEASRAANFTNEIGASNTIRFLRNVTGFWLLQESLREWRREDVLVDAASLTDAAVDVPLLRGYIDVQQPEFVAPGDMPARVRAACKRVTGVSLSSPAEIARCIFDSMALAVRRAIREACALAGRDVSVVHIVGGGVANTLFCQLVADACQLPVVAGPTEAASWGNVLSQASALGFIEPGLAAGREQVRRAEPSTRYEPRSPEAPWARAEAVLFG
jgi:rhamnulokinase